MEGNSVDILRHAKDILRENIIVVIIASSGLICLICGLILFSTSSKPEIVLESQSDKEQGVEEIVADIEGAVMKPGIYRLSSGSRIQDLLVLAGGLSSEADRDYIQKRINLAQKLTDGAKIYIPQISETAKNSSMVSVLGSEEVLININTASSIELESLPGIGKITAQKIIDSRPYGSVEELLEKKVVGNSVFEKIKDKITVY